MTKVDKNIDALVAAADAMVRQAEAQFDNIEFVLNQAAMPEQWHHKITAELEVARKSMVRYRAAREAVRKGTPPAFATSA